MAIGARLFALIPTQTVVDLRLPEARNKASLTNPISGLLSVTPLVFEQNCHGFVSNSINQRDAEGPPIFQSCGGLDPQIPKSLCSDPAVNLVSEWLRSLEPPRRTPRGIC